MNKPLVSIHIVTYNQIEFIHETLTSALEQDYENLEVVVADDGSSDGTAEVISEYATKYPERLIPIVGGQNLGITKNSNRALKACQGKYIAFQAGDDVLLPGKISKQVEWMEADERRVLCGHDVEIFDSASQKTICLWSKIHHISSGSGAYTLIKYGSLFASSAIMVRANAIPPYGFDERILISSDWKFWIDCLASGGLFGYVDGIYGRYRKHDNNVTNINNSSYKICSQDIFASLGLVEACYPHLIKACRYGRAFQFYVQGRVYLFKGEKHVARIYLLNSVYQNWFVSWKIIFYLFLTFISIEKLNELRWVKKSFSAKFGLNQ